MTYIYYTILAHDRVTTDIYVLFLERLFREFYSLQIAGYIRFVILNIYTWHLL